MMKNTGGPAFPLDTSTAILNPGITIRDYFAAKAMQGWLATYGDHKHPACVGTADTVARNAYAMADAMLAARNEERN